MRTSSNELDRSRFGEGGDMSQEPESSEVMPQVYAELVADIGQLVLFRSRGWLA